MLRRICIVSVLRVIWIKNLLSSPDFTWDFVAISNWTSIEVNTSIVCVCLLVTKPLFMTLWCKLRFKSGKFQTKRNGRQSTIGSTPVQYGSASDGLFAHQGNSFVSERPLVDDPEALPMHGVNLDCETAHFNMLYIS